LGQSDNVGERVSQLKLFRDADLLDGVYADFDFAAHWTRSGFVGTPAFVSVVKAFSRGSVAIERAILRRWGIR